MPIVIQEQLQRLLSPRSIAVFGGSAAAEVVRQCRQLGYAGDIWPVHPRRDSVEGIACFPDTASLPAAPDASFIAVPRDGTVQLVGELHALGAGGVICYASGFAEVGGAGVQLQRELVRAAADMALLGPNCYGMLNYLDGVALWPDQHGGERIDRGVAIVTQSGNIGLNLTMQRRNLPLAYLITVGNKAGAGIETIVDALLSDSRVSAIGLHIESLDDVAAFSRAAVKALGMGVPIVALKAGSSVAGARTTMSHTSSLAGPDALYDALFARFGVARVMDLPCLIESLKFLHVHGSLAGNRIISASCSGGEASLVADLAQPLGLVMPELPADARIRLQAAVGDKVSVANPLDYHTYIWGDAPSQTECFGGLMDCGFDMHLLVLDFPRYDRCSVESWQTTLQAFVSAKKASGAAACVVSSLPECMPGDVGLELMLAGLAPMQGIGECLQAIAHAAMIGHVRHRLLQCRPLLPATVLNMDVDCILDEYASKMALAEFGMPLPRGAVCSANDAGTVAGRIGFPVVVKAVSNVLAHKTEAGAVHLNLQSMQAVSHAVSAMEHLSDRFLVESMVTGAVAELIVGVRCDPQFGLTLTIGAGGVLVELLSDVANLLFPVSRDDVGAALKMLRIWPLLKGYRGRAAGDVDGLVDAVMAVVAYAKSAEPALLELDVNPVLVMPQGRGVLAVDAFIRLASKE